MKKGDRDYWLKFVSLIGAGIIGFGLGVYFAEAFQDYALWIVTAGVIIHGYAMYKNYRG